VLMVPIQHPDPRTPVQELPSVAMPAETPLGSRLRRDQKAPGPDPRTRSHQNCGAARRRAVQPSGPSFSHNYRCRNDVRPTGGRRRRRRGQRGFGVGRQGARGTTRIFEGGRGKAWGSGLGFSRSLAIFFGLSFVYFCPSSSGGQRAGGFILMALGNPSVEAVKCSCAYLVS